MRNIIDKHYSCLRKEHMFIRCDLKAWYIKEAQYGSCSNLAYNLRDFIVNVNTELHIRIKYRLNKGLSVYGKES